MTLRHKRWIRPDKLPDDHKDHLPRTPNLLVRLLYNRGIAEPDAVQAFLDRRPPHDDDPYQFQQMETAVARVKSAIRDGESIAVYGDFDADGVTATVLLVQALRAMGARLVLPYIPSRLAEGYGLNEDALNRLANGTYGLDDDMLRGTDKGRHSLSSEPLDRLAKRQISLLITVDCGIRALEQVARAKELGMDIIITDHHQVTSELPEAVAIINPKRPGETYPEKELAGVGVAFKLVQALAQSGLELYGIGVDDLLDLVALGSVADLALLLGENRSLVYRGLEVINRARRPGIKALLDAANVRPGQATAATIGYALGPRINAAGRMEGELQTGSANMSDEGDRTNSAYVAAKLLITQDPGEAAELAEQLSSLNRLRQEQTREQTRLAEELALAADSDPYLLFAAGRGFPQGIVGLIAGRLAEKYYRPAIVATVRDATEDREAVAVGSCRSIEEFHITEALDRCAELLVKHGGHRAAAGFTVELRNLPHLQQRLTAIAGEKLAAEPLVPKLHVDEELELSATLFPTVQEQLAWMEPCGYGNPTPLLYSGNVRVTSARTVGRDGAHLKLTLAEHNHYFDAIAFRMGGVRNQVLGSNVDIVYYLEDNEWRGQRRMQLNIQDMRPAGEG